MQYLSASVILFSFGICTFGQSPVAVTPKPQQLPLDGLSFALFR